MAILSTLNNEVGSLTQSNRALESLILGFGVAGLSWLVIRWSGIGKYGRSGPYVAGEVSYLHAVQRCLIDNSKNSIKVDWHPLDSLPKSAGRRSTNNGHAVAGAVRDAARRTINMAVIAGGFQPFEISPSVHSNRDTPRAHPHYAASDLDQDFSDEVPEPGQAVVCIDTDYYVQDWSKYLVGGPAIFHTFSPTTVAGTDGDCRFRVKGNSVVYEVSGGGSWSHPVWDWTAFGEFVQVDAGFRSWRWYDYLLAVVGIQKSLLYKVAFARPWEDCPHRALVWLLPQYSYYRCHLLPSDMHARSPGRVSYGDTARKGWNSLVTLRGVEPWISLGREGEDLAVSIQKEHYDAIMGLKTVQSVTTRCLNIGVKDPVTLAMVCQYFENKSGSPSVPERLANPYQKPKVHWPLSSYADEAEISARIYSPPLVSDENMMPMIKRWETHSASLDTRVFSVRNDKVPESSHLPYIREFLEMLVPEPNTGVPYSIEETVPMLGKPSQVLMIQNIWDTADVEPRKLIESFVKNEPCKKDGRIISSFPDMRYLLHFSKFTLKLRDEVLHAEHNNHWFMPGKTPADIADEVCRYVSGVDDPMEIDYVNYDGRVSAWCQRNIMNAAYKRYFDPAFHAELDGYLNTLISCPARSKRFGFRYDAGPGVKSGSPTTCDANTILNGYMQYYAVRRYYGQSLPRELAFQQVGLAFGDDSLFSSKFKKFVNAGSDHLGMEVKCEVYKPDEGIVFLARVFPDPLSTASSFQDPLRTLRKLHVTTRNPSIPIADAAYDRCTGYLVTDALTPLVSNYCNAMVRVYGPEVASHEKRIARKTRDREKPYWYSAEANSWPQAEADIPLMTKCMSARTGIPEDKISEMSDALDSLESPWDSPTYNREAEAFPWKGTVYPDGTPGEAVDHRSIQRKQQLTNQHGRDINGEESSRSRSNPESNSECIVSTGSDSKTGTDERGDRRPSDGGPRHQQPGDVPIQEHVDDAAGPVQLSREADRPSVDRGRGGRGRSDRGHHRAQGPDRKSGPFVARGNPRGGRGRGGRGSYRGRGSHH